MAAAIPRPSRPSYGPPTTALPALPVSKSRKSVGGLPTNSELNSASSATGLSRSGLRAPSTSQLPPPTTPGGSATLPKQRTPSGINGPNKTVRKTISINAFPQPPRGVRTTSLPPSPLSGGHTPGTPLGVSGLSRRGSEDGNTAGKPRKKKTGSPKSQSQGYISNATPSLLNGSGDSRSISSGAGARGSDGLLSLPSPPQSRSSSAQDSYSTSATTYEDNLEGPRGRDLSAETSHEKRTSKPAEGKGNVIVSVRVRPDAGANGASKTEGEWMVDGRRALVAYKGKEGGDYYFGK